MKSTQEVGAWAAMVRGILYVVLVYVLIVAWPHWSGTGPASQLTDVTNAFYNTSLAVVVSLIVLGDGVSSVLLALGLCDLLQAGAPTRMRYAMAAATIAGALFIGYAMIGIAGRQEFGRAISANLIATPSPVLGEVLQGMLDGAVFMFSVSVLLWYSAARDTKNIPKPLGYLMLVGGVLGLLQILIAPLLLISIAVNVVWSLWLGYKLLGDLAPASGAAS
jgi:hypothetical protein